MAEERVSSVRMSPAVASRSMRSRKSAGRSCFPKHHTLRDSSANRSSSCLLRGEELKVELEFDVIAEGESVDADRHDAEIDAEFAPLDRAGGAESCVAL